MTSNRELARHHIAALRAEGAGKLHLAGLLENLLGESRGRGKDDQEPPPPLYQGESALSGGPASQDVPAPTHDQHGEAHDHLLPLPPGVTDEQVQLAALRVSRLLAGLEAGERQLPALAYWYVGVKASRRHWADSDATNDHLLALARNAYEAWRSLYRVAMPTGLGDVADGEWIAADKAMEALDRFMAYGEFSTNPIALPADVEVGITAEMEPSPAFSGPFTPDPHVYRPDYHRGEKTQLCSVCGGPEHTDVHRRGAQLAREAITGKR